MRYGSLSDRLTLFQADRALDVERHSSGAFSSDPQAVYDCWEEFMAWARTVDFAAAEPYDNYQLCAPVPCPRQLLAVGLNYVHPTYDPQTPASALPVFTKFVSSITGPYADVPHPGGHSDWEVELVVVIGRGGHRISRDDAWSHVAGLTACQDLSERILQKAGTLPQFNLGKSYAGFLPMGPWVVTPDELDNPDDLFVETRVNGQAYQSARTSDMIMSVPALIEYLSKVVTLLPGDIILTGTPVGVGEHQTPEVFLEVGDVIDTTIEGIGQMRNTMIEQKD